MNKETEFPAAFIEQCKNYFKEDFPELMAALQKKASLSIRWNSKKINEEISQRPGKQVPWESSAFYLEERPIFTLDPLFQAGAYYVQEASSMFVGYVFDFLRRNADQEKWRIADLCAAPGGKSTHLLAKMQDEDLLLCNEVVKNRSSILCENLIRWGSPQVLVSNNRIEDFSALASFFDLILVDAPCSGEGMFRKDPQAIREWSPQHVKTCALRQKKLLESILPCLASGAYLIYCTCTYAYEENEGNLKDLLGNFPFVSVRIPLGKEWGIIEKQHFLHQKEAFSYHFYSHRLQGEGFFLTILQLQSELEARPAVTGKKKKNFPEKANKNERSLIEPFIDQPDNFHFLKINQSFHLLPQSALEDFILLKENFYFQHAGIRCGSIKGKDFIPEQDLALSFCLNKKLPLLELDLENSLKYLKKQEIQWETLPSPGWYPVSYQQQRLGWIKALPNRINNYFPAEWRIRMDLNQVFE